ncbi:hypothetical protein [Sphingomonas sp. CARO-RG-8B-R24-01]|uniref:head-tail joining protein n=1 Tax=Sphingomonas sp. CARO-RG-8B-R24-01 TaxID=2914831 RepID=UPI001F5A45E4|nr:hypothetical protein [Sphingomonas sp. CARO-RG-8B-R24-01]
MAISWDSELLGPVMAVFGEGSGDDPSSWPTYTNFETGYSFPLRDAVFDEEYDDVKMLDGIAESSKRPVLGVRLSLFAYYPKQNDVVAIPSVNGSYIVIDVKTDGHGHALLMLQGPLQ